MKPIEISDEKLLQSWSYLSDEDILKIVNDPRRDVDMDKIRKHLLNLRGIFLPKHYKDL